MANLLKSPGRISIFYSQINLNQKKALGLVNFLIFNNYQLNVLKTFYLRV